MAPLSALALAANGLGVTVIESTVEYPDPARGGSASCHGGVNEARRLGAEDVLLKAGARVSPLFVEYAEGVGRTAEIDLDEMVPGVPAPWPDRAS